MYTPFQAPGAFGYPAVLEAKNHPLFGEELPNLFHANRAGRASAGLNIRDPRYRHLMNIVSSYLNDINRSGHSAAPQTLVDRLFASDTYRRAGGMDSRFDPYRDPAMQLARLLQPQHAGCGPRTFAGLEGTFLPRVSEMLREPLRAAYNLAAMDAIGRPMENIFGALRKHPAEVRRMVDDCPCIFGLLRPESRHALQTITGSIPRSALRCVHSGSTTPQIGGRRHQCLHDYRDILPEFRMQFAPRCSCCGGRTRTAGSYDDSGDEYGNRYSYDDYLFDLEDDVCLGHDNSLMLAPRAVRGLPRRAHNYRDLNYY